MEGDSSTLPALAGRVTAGSVLRYIKLQFFVPEACGFPHFVRAAIQKPLRLKKAAWLDAGLDSAFFFEEKEAILWMCWEWLICSCPLLLPLPTPSSLWARKWVIWSDNWLRYGFIPLIILFKSFLRYHCCSVMFRKAWSDPLNYFFFFLLLQEIKNLNGGWPGK